MRLADLLYALPPVVPAQPAFPRRLKESSGMALASTSSPFAIRRLR